MRFRVKSLIEMSVMHHVYMKQNNAFKMVSYERQTLFGPLFQVFTDFWTLTYMAAPLLFNLLMFP